MVQVQVLVSGLKAFQLQRYWMMAQMLTQVSGLVALAAVQEAQQLVAAAAEVRQ